jgi:hypothetical protein
MEYWNNAFKTQHSPTPIFHCSSLLKAAIRRRYIERRNVLFISVVVGVP